MPSTLNSRSNRSINKSYSHSKGKEFASKAVLKIEKELEALNSLSQKQPGDKKLGSIITEKNSLLAIANYNLGSQHEFLEEFPDAIGRYLIATKLAQSNKGSALAEEFASSLKQAKARYAGYKMRSTARTFSNLDKEQVEEAWNEQLQIQKNRSASNSRPFSAKVFH